MGDLAAVVAFSREHGLTSVIDATFATPVLCQPCAQLGFDVAVHSMTKYLNGHSDVVAGAVAGSAAFIAKVGSHPKALTLYIRRCISVAGVCAGSRLLEQHRRAPVKHGSTPLPVSLVATLCPNARLYMVARQSRGLMRCSICQWHVSHEVRH